MGTLQPEASPASLDDALTAFLRAELDSPTERRRLKRSLEALRLHEGIVRNANPANKSEAQTRAELFHHYRGTEALFDGLVLAEVNWFRSALQETDLRCRTFTCRNNFEKRFGTRSLDAVAAQIQNGTTIPAGGNVARVLAGEKLEPPLLLTDPNWSRYVVLEGHNRLLAYLQGATDMFFPIEVLAGVSPNIERWCQW